MRRNTFPPRPRAEDSRLRAPAPERTLEQPKRKTFNCIVDDTALIAGAKKSTRDGIRKWVSQDAIRLYVPLHTLTLLNRLKTGNERVNLDAREALQWLDDITSTPGIDGRVQLEGGEEAYATWHEVEEFLLPETLLSMEDSESDEEYLEDLESSFNALDVSDKTSMSSAHSLEQSPKSPRSAKLAFPAASSVAEGAEVIGSSTLDLHPESPARTARNSIDHPRTEKSLRNGIPHHLHPLFSHILWRINRETNPGAALESFILLTNDPTKQMIAQKFGIRAKRLDQLRDAVAREEREYKNHLAMFKMEADARNNKGALPPSPRRAERPKSSHSNISKPAIDSDDEDEVLLKRAPRGPANPTNNQRVFDPNDFGRTNPHSPRGGRGGFVPRGRGGAPRSRGGFAPRGAYVPPGAAFRPQPAPTQAPRLDPNKPIDPDSFARSMPRGGGMRGSRRTLWEPN